MKRIRQVFHRTIKQGVLFLNVGGGLNLGIRCSSAFFSTIFPHSNPRSVVKAPLNYHQDPNNNNWDHTGGNGPDILVSFSKVLGIKDVSKIPPETKLVDIAMESVIEKMQETLESEHKITLTPREIRKLTFGSLHSIKSGSFVRNYENYSRYMQSNRKYSRNQGVWPHENLIRLSPFYDYRPGELFTSNFPKFFFVPGFDGHVHLLDPLTEQVQADSYGFQLPPQLFSVEDIAAQYIKEMKLIQPEGPYNISAFSFGGIIGFEMARQLESQHHDRVSNLVLLDGFVTQKDRDVDLRQIFQVLLRDFRHTSDYSMDFAQRLSKTDWTKNYEIGLEFLHKKLPDYNFDKLTRLYLQQLRRYADALVNYQPNYKYSGNAVLVKTSMNESYISPSNINYDNYGDRTSTLRDYCQDYPTVYTVNGSHETFLSPAKVHETAQILNKILCRDEADEEEYYYLSGEY